MIFVPAKFEFGTSVHRSRSLISRLHGISLFGSCCDKALIDSFFSLMPSQTMTATRHYIPRSDDKRSIAAQLKDCCTRNKIRHVWAAFTKKDASTERMLPLMALPQTWEALEKIYATTSTKRPEFDEESSTLLLFQVVKSNSPSLCSLRAASKEEEYSATPKP